jgi:ferredoxin
MPGTTATHRKSVRPQLDIARRTSSFDEVQGGLSEDNALFEARRCLSCGNCFECDNCYGVCPDNAVVKLGRETASSSTTTTARAAACASPSARAAPIEMVPEQG